MSLGRDLCTYAVEREALRRRHGRLPCAYRPFSRIATLPFNRVAGHR